MLYLKFLKLVLFLGLLGGSLIFVEKNIEDYIAGGTSYSVTQQQLSPNDLPAVTICWPLEYLGGERVTSGENFLLDARVTHNEDGHTHTEITTLIENRWVRTLHSLQILLSQLWVIDGKDWKSDHPCMLKRKFTSKIPEKRQCYKITARWNGNEEINFNGFRVELAFKFFNDSGSSPGQGEVLFSSDENSFGLAKGVWFDGEVDCFPIVYSGGFFKIIEVSEYLHLKSLCSHSYYHCLADRLSNFDFTRAKINYSGTQCNFEKLCAPVSLPYNRSQIPICSTDRDQACFGKILGDLILDQEKYCQKSCRVENFKTLRSKKWVTLDDYDKWNWTGWIQRRSFLLGYEFDLASVNTNRRSIKPFKTVHSEYLIMNGMSLVGNIGGTLGMFIGFSLIGATDWFFDHAKKLWSRMTRRSLKE